MDIPCLFMADALASIRRAVGAQTIPVSAVNVVDLPTREPSAVHVDSDEELISMLLMIAALDD